MLPMVAMLAAGYMAKSGGAAATQSGTSAGGLGGLLGGLLSGQSAGAAAAPHAAQPGLASMLDLNGDGNTLDDILRIAGKFTH